MEQRGARQGRTTTRRLEQEERWGGRGDDLVVYMYACPTSNSFLQTSFPSVLTSRQTSPLSNTQQSPMQPPPQYLSKRRPRRASVTSPPPPLNLKRCL